MKPADIRKKARFILGVPDDADRNTIRHVYRTLVKKCHPDLNPNDKSLEKKFILITEAYEVLCNEKNAGRYGILKAEADVKESHLYSESYWEWWMERYKDLI